MYKVLVIGDANSGKTSLVNRAVNNTFSDNYKVTIQCEFGTKVLELDNQIRYFVSTCSIINKILYGVWDYNQSFLF